MSGAMQTLGDLPCAGSARRRLARMVPVLPLLAMAAGLLLPDLAALAHRALPALLVATTLLGFLALAPPLLPPGPLPSLAAALGPPLLLVLALGLAAPLLGCGAAWLLGAGAEARLWVALAAAAPVGTGAIGLGVALGLGGGRSLAVVAASTAAAPLLLPAVAAVLGSPGGVEPAVLAERLWLLGVLPALAALPLRRWPPLRTEAARRHCAGGAVLALSLTALARMDGLGPLVAAQPVAMLRLAGLACLPGLAGILAAWLLLRRSLPEAVLIGGYRNVTLVWAACPALLSEQGRLFMALTALPVFATPALATLARRVISTLTGRHTRT
jgi:hypothetical protein